MQNGNTALHDAAANDFVAVFKALLKNANRNTVFITNKVDHATICFGAGF